MSFSSGVVLSNSFEDFISPAQDCIIPVKQPMGIAKVVIIADQLQNIIQENEQNEQETPVKITLEDCLACSGCKINNQRHYISRVSFSSSTKSIRIL